MTETPVRRRDFIATTSLVALGMGLLKETLLAQESSSVASPLPEELTPEEIELTKGSIMATEVMRYFKDYSGAESGRMVSLRYLGQPEELVWVAGGFGGGLVHEDRCGFLTSGIMGIGLLAGMLPMKRKEAKEQCRKMVKDYWQAWSSLAPLHCSEIRKGKKGYKVCHRIGVLASATLGRLWEPAKTNLASASTMQSPR